MDFLADSLFEYVRPSGIILVNSSKNSFNFGSLSSINLQNFWKRILVNNSILSANVNEPVVKNKLSYQSIK